MNAIWDYFIAFLCLVADELTVYGHDRGINDSYFDDVT